MSESVSDSTSRTNWARVDALNDDEIDTADDPALSDDFFRRATWRRPGPVSVTVRVDPEIVAWYHAQGEECFILLSAAIVIYSEAHRGL